MTKSTSVTIRLTPELRARIKKSAHRWEVSQSQFITLALEVQCCKALKEVKS